MRKLPTSLKALLSKGEKSAGSCADVLYAKVRTRIKELIPMLLLVCDKHHKHFLQGLVEPLVKAICLQ